VGNSSGDENGIDPMKYWEIVALPRRFYPLFYPLVEKFRHYLGAREIMRSSRFTQR
jgi:hypothetical protein